MVIDKESICKVEMASAHLCALQDSAYNCVVFVAIVCKRWVLLTVFVKQGVEQTH